MFGCLLFEETCLHWSHVSFSKVSSSSWRGKGRSLVSRGVRERGGIGGHYPPQRTRKWVCIQPVYPLHSLVTTDCVALLFVLKVWLNYSTQNEMSSTGRPKTNRNRAAHSSITNDKHVIPIVMFWPTCHVLNAAEVVYVENMKGMFWEFLTP